MMNAAQLRDLETFVETDAYRTIRTYFDYALRTRQIVRVIGDSGLGKTVALTKLVHETGARMFTVTQTNKSTGGMYQAISTAFNYGRDGQYLRQFETNAKYAVAINPQEDMYEGDPLTSLHGQARILLVDEYQTFEATALRELQEFCRNMQLPLLLCGNSESLADRSKLSRQAIEQLRQRMLMCAVIGKPSNRDCRDIGVSFNVEGVETYEALTAYGMRTSLRELVDLLQKATVITGGEGSIKRATLEAALLHYGGESALKLLSPPRANVRTLGDNAKRLTKTA
jgi:AAA domain